MEELTDKATKHGGSHPAETRPARPKDCVDVRLTGVPPLTLVVPLSEEIRPKRGVVFYKIGSVNLGEI